MRPGVVAVDRVVVEGASLTAAQAEGFRAALASRLAAELRGWAGPSRGGALAGLPPLVVPEGAAADPEALANELGARVARLLKEGT